jgi:hypothetical protein
MDMSEFNRLDLENRVMEVENKQRAASHME